MPSAFITWIFAKSIHNSALLGGRYGMGGGVAYSAWYISFLSAATVGYVLRTKYGYKSLPEAINNTYGPLACLLFMFCVLFRLFNEVWSNATVVGQFYGRVGTSGYWGAAWFSVVVPSLYIALGGMRGSLFTDFVQAWGGILILIIVIIALSADSTFDDNIFSFKPNRVQKLNKGGEPGWEPGWILPVAGGLLQGICSYPFFDSVLTDRAFLSTPKTMFVSLVTGGTVAGTFIIFFSSLGTYGAYHSDVFAENCDCTASAATCLDHGLVLAPGRLTATDCAWWAANKKSWGSWGTSAYVGTLLAKNVDEFMQVLMNFIMMTASLSTLDSTFTSIAKLLALEFGGWLRLHGDTRGISAPLRPHDVEHISETHIWLARASIFVLMFTGLCFLGFEKDAMSATTVAGTAIMGIGFPIWTMLIWKTDTGDGKGWRKAPLAFILPLILGWWFGISYYSDGKKDVGENRMTHDNFQFTNYDNTYTCETMHPNYANCMDAAVGAKYGTATKGCTWLTGNVNSGGVQQMGSCISVDASGNALANGEKYSFTVTVVLHYSRFFCSNLVGHLCCLGAMIIGWCIHQFVIPNWTDPVMAKPDSQKEAPGGICSGNEAAIEPPTEANAVESKPDAEPEPEASKTKAVEAEPGAEPEPEAEARA
jgi:Na+/proline symporter